MNGASAIVAAASGVPKERIASILILFSLLAALAPVFMYFSQTAWRQEENAHAPFIIAACLATAFHRAASLTAPGRLTRIESTAAVCCAIAAAALAVIGRRYQIDIFLSLAQPGFAAAAALAFGGWRAVRHFWFPITMTAYLLVWPGWAIDMMTAPLKLAIAEIVSGGLYAAGLPVARAGAVISVGPYELMIVDACAGLNSLLALTAIGAIYLYIVKRPSVIANILLFAAAIPLAVIANLVRVALLVLITHYFGYDAGQGFLHDGAGLVMFAISLCGFFVLDAATGVFPGRHSRC